MQGFQQPFPDLHCPTFDGKNFILLGNLDFIASDGTHYRAIRGTSSDGPSIPQRLWSAISPVGAVWACGVLHDAAYRGTLVVVNADGTESTVTLDRAQRDGLLMDAMIAQGIGEVERQEVYQAVRLAGESSLEGDLALPLPSPV